MTPTPVQPMVEFSLKDMNALNKVSFLDAGMKIVEKKFTEKLFNKCNTFLFAILHYFFP